MKRQAAVIGLGRFGSSVARELYQLGHDVLAIDHDEAITQELVGQVTYSVTADATSEAALKDMGVQNFDTAIVGIGTDVQSSILATVLVKTLGLKLVVARANNPWHGRTLAMVGADKVIYPEQETAVNLAHSLFNPQVVDYMEITANYGISKVRPPEHLLNHTLEEAGLTGYPDKDLAVLAIMRGGDHILNPSKREMILGRDLLIMAGRDGSLEKLRDGSNE